jgi:hypothetical protein
MTSRWSLRWAILLIGLAAYGPALRTGFLYDDHLLIETNPALRSWSGATLRQDFTSGIFPHTQSSVDFYRPVQTLSTRLEYTLWRLRPLPYHLTNLLLHLANALLLNELLLLLGAEALLAALAGGMFAAHPVIVEGLLMVSGRGELLGLFFMFLSIWAYLRDPRRGWIWSAAAFLFAVFSKESAVLTPVLIALLLAFQKSPARRYRGLLPMAGLAGTYLLLRENALGRTGLDLTGMQPIRFLGMVFPRVLLHYGRLIVFPYDLHTDRILTPAGLQGLALSAGVILAGLAVATRGPRWLRLAGLWFVLNLLPKTVMMMSGSFLSDHWAYPLLPSILVPLAWALARAWTLPRARARAAGQLACAFLLFAEISWVHVQIKRRNTDEKLYRSALRYPTTSTMSYNLAMLLVHQGRIDEARPYLQALHLPVPSSRIP